MEGVFGSRNRNVFGTSVDALLVDLTELSRLAMAWRFWPLLNGHFLVIRGARATWPRSAPGRDSTSSLARLQHGLHAAWNERDVLVGNWLVFNPMELMFCWPSPMTHDIYIHTSMYYK